MGPAHSITCGLPFCQHIPGEETNLSICLRVTTVALGSFVLIAGILIISGLGADQLLGQFTILTGVTTLSIGVFVALLGLSIKCVKEQSPIRQEGSPRSRQDISKQVPKRIVSQPPREIASPPKKILLSKLPEWLHSYLEDVPYLPNDSGLLKDLKSQTNASVAVFFHSQTIGLYMKLTVEHHSIDPLYDRRSELTELFRGVNLPSSQQPFPLYVVVFNEYNDDYNSWYLNSETDTIMHRNGPFDIDNILGANRFRYLKDNPLQKDTIEQLIDTEKQDDVPENYQHSLAWILPRLLQKGHLEVRERRTDLFFTNFEDPVVGYWKISLDRH